MANEDDASLLPDLQELVKALSNEEFDAVSVLRNRSVPAPIQPIVNELLLIHYIYTEQYDAARQILAESELSNVELFASYISYKEKHYKQLVDGKTNVGSDYLAAQALYRLHQHDQAAQLYMKLLSSSSSNVTDDVKLQLYTNLVANWMAGATPYSSSSDGAANPSQDEWTATIESYLHNFNDNNNSEYPYELAFNVASWKLLTLSDPRARQPYHKLLQTAIAHCTRLHSDNHDDLQRELQPMQYNQQLFAHHFWDVKAVPPTNDINSSSIEVLNQTLDQPGSPDSNFTALQKTLYTYNLVLSKLNDPKMGKALLGSLEKQTKDKVWWDARIVALKSLLHPESASKIVDEFVERLQNNTQEAMSESSRDEAIAYVQLYHPDGAVTAVPSSIAQLPAHCETEPSTSCDAADRFEYFLSRTQYQQAASVYEHSTDPIEKLQYLKVMTFVDPHAAQKIAQEMDLSPCTSSTHGAKLELQEPPVVRRSAATSTMPDLLPEEPTAETKPKKSRDAILRYRAKKRETYVEELERRGRARAIPDPDRWLPKYQRGRYRHKGGGGHQGGASEKQSNKYDVVARQHNPKSSTSTAHLTVARGKSAKRR